MHKLADLSTRYMSLFNAFLVVWLWFGRMFVGTAGWMMIIFTVTVIPVLAIALTTTSVMVRRRYPIDWDAEPDKQVIQTLSRPQTIAQLVAWIGLAGTGLFLVDMTDTTEGSIVSAFFGHSSTMVGASAYLSIAFAIVFGVGWFTLLGLLIARGPKKTAEQRALIEAARITD